jgi:Secretion system C-terminal sorting domain/PA domain
MTKNTLCLLAFLTTFSLAAQITVADSTWLSVYNTGKRYQLKNAPFGEQKPKKGVILSMVFAYDSVTIKKNDDTKNFKPMTLDEIKAKVKAISPTSPNAPPPPVTAQELAFREQNKGKRTCDLSAYDIKGNLVLIDFDKNCDPTYKCLQAQKAGASVAIFIIDNDKKDSLAMAKGRYDNDIKIPCFSISRSQGDSIRRHLPSKVALFTPRVQALALDRGEVLVFSAFKSDDKTRAVLQWQNNTQPDNSHFVIERSTDGEKYERLGEIDAKGLSKNLQTYTLEDDLPFEEDNLYRLVLKKANGKEIVTEPQLLNFPIVKGFDVYPNPASEEITLQLKQFDGKTIDILLYDGVGKQLHKEHIENNTVQKKTLNLTQFNLTEGVYNLVVLHKGRAFSRRFVHAR